MQSAASYKLRFYEEDPTVKFSVEMLFSFPEGIKTLIASGCNKVAMKDYKAHELLTELKSIGSEKVISLHKAKLKRRSYDQNPTIHQVMLYILILSPESRKEMAGKMSELMELMQGYLQLCRAFKVAPQKEVFEKISDAYAQQGMPLAKQLMASIQTKYAQRQKAQAEEAQTPGETVTTEGEAVKENGHEMKIRQQDTS